MKFVSLHINHKSFGDIDNGTQLFNYPREALDSPLNLQSQAFTAVLTPHASIIN